ncbi:hypothetical protein AMELA_G00039170 [Ameiurus melas]|uniref:Uncharacterized protein n=1 Tax=Ameiurus melas TaxID=219545 RepID=A0A7J6BBB0_AMEME|nr:hypothetical protein AMELA_G00039170 [Ameiurus melas]
MFSNTIATNYSCMLHGHLICEDFQFILQKLKREEISQSRVQILVLTGTIQELNSFLFSQVGYFFCENDNNSIGIFLCVFTLTQVKHASRSN